MRACDGGGDERDVVKIIALDQQGHSTGAIASSVGLPEEFVVEVLGRAREVEEAEQGNLGGGG